jgi:hypothetical protein
MEMQRSKPTLITTNRYRGPKTIAVIIVVTQVLMQ